MTKPNNSIDIKLNPESRVHFVTNEDSILSPNSKHLLYGYLFFPKINNRNPLIADLKKIWRTTDNYEIFLLDQNIFYVEFNSKADLLRVMRGEPWHHNNGLIILKQVSEFLVPKPEDFFLTSFDIQLSNVPRSCFNDNFCQLVGNLIGNYQYNYPSLLKDGSTRFVRLRVEIDCRQPLQRSLTIRLPGAPEDSNFDIKYELLPDFCSFCGMLSHNLQSCSEAMKFEDTGNEVTELYTRDLRVRALVPRNTPGALSRVFRNTNFQKRDATPYLQSKESVSTEDLIKPANDKGKGIEEQMDEKETGYKFKKSAKKPIQAPKSTT